jgi:hypothetical protein
MRFSLIGAVVPALAFCNIATAQVDGQFDGTVTPTPTIGATSPLGVASSPTGIPLGSTEITSPGVSPLPAGVTGTVTIPTNPTSTACPTVATPPSEMFGSTANFDGGGTSAGAASAATAASPGASAMSGTTAAGSSETSVTSEMPVTSGSSGVLDTSGMSGMCGAGSNSIAASSSPTLTTPGGVARTGIPFGSFEINNLGVSSTPPVPLPNVSPIVGTLGPSSQMPTIPALSSTTTSTSRGCTDVVGTAGSGGLGNAGDGDAGVSGSSIPARLLRNSILCQRK